MVARIERDHALIYVRVSRLDDDERQRKISPEMQRDMSLGLQHVQTLKTEVFEDLDISGKSTTNRPQYQALLQRLAGGECAMWWRTTCRALRGRLRTRATS